jgi:hypothetical protein
MRAARLAGCIAFTAVVTRGSSGIAQTLEEGPIAGMVLSEGPRWAWAAPPAATMGGAGIFGGWRKGSVRGGALGQLSWWDGSRGPAVDMGGFFTWDFFSLVVDPQLSAATFLRLEPAVRWESESDLWGLAPAFVLGGRAAGIEIGFGATYELRLSNLGGDPARSGVDAQLRIGCDVVELVHLFQHLKADGTPPTP